MNEKLQRLWVICGMPNEDLMDIIYKKPIIVNEEYINNFAELIIKECIITIQMDIPRNGSNPENIRSRAHVQAIADKFGIKLPLEVNYKG